MPHVTCKKQKDRIVVATDYWRIEHDLRAGGCWSSIRFHKGSRKNLLASPVTSRLRFFKLVPGTMYNDYTAFLECGEKHPKVSITKTASGSPVVTCEGHYADEEGKKLPIRYRRRYEYRDWGLVASDLEVMPERNVPEVVEFSAAAFTLRPGMTDLHVREHPACDKHSDLLALGDWHKIGPGCASYSQRYTPIHLCLFEKDVEGIDFAPSSRLADWDTQLTGQPGQGLTAVATDADGAAHVEINPFCRAFRRIPITMERKTYRFSMYWGVPYVKPRDEVSVKYFHASVHSDWAADADLERLADAGVKLIRFHCDYRDNGLFWRDGMYPPFDEAGMAELRRMIDTSHRLGMKIIPYVSLKEFHPDSPGYAENHDAWTQRPLPDSPGIHTHIRNGEFGQVMCMESDWLAFRKQACDIMLSDLPWDGLYFDWCCPHACMHPDHAPGAYHTDTDGFYDFLFYARHRVGPDGILLLHLSGLPYMAAENMMDLGIVYEDTQGVLPRPGECPPQCDFVPINHRCLAVGPSDPLIGRKFIIGGLLQGHPAPTQVPSKSDSAFHPALLEEMAHFGRTDLSRFRFSRASDRPVETGREDVFAALWHRPGEALVYLGNFSEKGARGTFTLDPSMLGKRAAGRKVAIEKMLPAGRTRPVGKKAASALKKSGVAYALKAWDSALYRIQLV